MQWKIIDRNSSFFHRFNFLAGCCVHLVEFDNNWNMIRIANEGKDDVISNEAIYLGAFFIVFRRKLNAFDFWNRFEQNIWSFSYYVFTHRECDAITSFILLWVSTFCNIYIKWTCLRINQLICLVFYIFQMKMSEFNIEFLNQTSNSIDKHVSVFLK